MRLWLRLRLWCAIAVVAWTLAACVPQVVVTQPHLLLHVLDEAGEPRPEGARAEVTLYWWEYPHRRQRAVTVAPTDAEGTVAFAETTAAETMMPLVPHGVPAYNWTFCVEAAGHKTLIGTVSNVEPGEAVEVNLTLHPGESFPVCANYERLHSHPGTPVEPVDATGGDVHGVYEVDAVNE